MDHALDFIQRFQETVSDSDGNDIDAQDVDNEVNQTFGAKFEFIRL